jgi:hypothetical protein
MNREPSVCHLMSVTRLIFVVTAGNGIPSHATVPRILDGIPYLSVQPLSVFNLIRSSVWFGGTLATVYRNVWYCLFAAPLDRATEFLLLIRCLFVVVYPCAGFTYMKCLLIGRFVMIKQSLIHSIIKNKHSTTYSTNACLTALDGLKLIQDFLRKMQQNSYVKV